MESITYWQFLNIINRASKLQIELNEALKQRQALMDKLARRRSNPVLGGDGAWMERYRVESRIEEVAKELGQTIDWSWQPPDPE